MAGRYICDFEIVQLIIGRWAHPQLVTNMTDMKRNKLFQGVLIQAHLGSVCKHLFKVNHNFVLFCRLVFIVKQTFI